MILFFICTFILLTIIGIILSTINIKIEEFKLSNYDKSGKLQYDYNIYLELLLLNKVKTVSIKINKDKLSKFNIKQKINLKKMQKNIPNKQSTKDILKKIKIEIDYLNLKLKIGTEDVILTSAIVALVASFIGIILTKIIKEYKEEKYKYEIYPIYENANKIFLSLNCIIKVKIVHIIFIIYLLFKQRRVDKNERTSNRRTYDYGYE